MILYVQRFLFTPRFQVFCLHVLSSDVVYLKRTNPPLVSLSELNNMHIIMNNVGLMFNVKYQSLFTTWRYKGGDVGDCANSSGKPRSCWDHRYTFCTSRNLTASRLNCEARFSVQVTTKQHAIQEQLTFALQHITAQLNICSKLWKLGLHTHYMVTSQVLCTFMVYYSGVFELNRESCKALSWPTWSSTSCHFIWLLQHHAEFSL
jgi:hypothetical protein